MIINCYYVGQVFGFDVGGVTEFLELQRVGRDYIWIGVIPDYIHCCGRGRA